MCLPPVRGTGSGRVTSAETDMTDGWRAALRRWLDSPAVNRVIIGLILLNAATLGLETSETVLGFAGGTEPSITKASRRIFTDEGSSTTVLAGGARNFAAGADGEAVEQRRAGIAVSSASAAPIRRARVFGEVFIRVKDARVPTPRAR